MRTLWDEQRAQALAQGQAGIEIDYLAEHFAMDLTIERRLAVIDAMIPYIGGRVLEWGCRHAFDSCVYRMRLGDRSSYTDATLRLKGRMRHSTTYSGLHYRVLRHGLRLDYADGFFDVITSNGVLEHVEDDESSAQEIWRKLKPGGTFVITCLPNAHSYTEAAQRWLKHPAHDRLYTIASTKNLLARAGFEIVGTRYHFMVPTMLNGLPHRVKAAYQRAHRVVWAANHVLERMPLINRLASNFMFVARKPESGELTPPPAAS